jgi:hypothetical protein
MNQVPIDSELGTVLVNALICQNNQEAELRSQILIVGKGSIDKDK